jgi:hypothetical protein
VLLVLLVRPARLARLPASAGRLQALAASRSASSLQQALVAVRRRPLLRAPRRAPCRPLPAPRAVNSSALRR